MYQRVMATLKCSKSKPEHFYRVFPAHPNFVPLSPYIIWARGKDSLTITSYEKGKVCVICE